LKEISGGVCAPKGFRASGGRYGIKADPEKKDLALIDSERPCGRLSPTRGMPTPARARPALTRRGETGCADRRPSFAVCSAENWRPRLSKRIPDGKVPASNSGARRCPPAQADRDRAKAGRHGQVRSRVFAVRRLGGFRNRGRAGTTAPEEEHSSWVIIVQPRRLVNSGRATII